MPQTSLRIRIEDLPQFQPLSVDEQSAIFGAGPRHTRLDLESLEVRALMAASITPKLLADGTLRIEGTTKADRIYVLQSDGASKQVWVGKAAHGSEYGKFSKVKRIEVIGLGGSDSINLNGTGTAHHVKVDSTIYGDGKTGEAITDGNDTIIGGDGKDTIWGRGGVDSLTGKSGHDYLYGGSGGDYLYGNDGDDHLYGNDGNDNLYGGADDDTLYGQGHNDRLLGNEGSDDLWGGAGQDYLNGGAGKDGTINGGTGTDTFRRDLFLAGSGFGLNGDEDKDDELDPEDAPADEPTQVAGAWLSEVVSSDTRDSQWDIDQAASPTCNFLAALAAVAERTGSSDDLIQKIQYNASTDQYGIKLYAQGAWKTIWVNGDWTEDRDPGGKLWVTLYQKAFLKAVGVTARDALGAALPSADWKSASDVWAIGSNCLTALTGRSAKYTGIGSATGSTLRQQIYDSGVLGMVAGTKASGTTAGVVANHAYMIYDAFTRYNSFTGQDDWYVRLYNPWAHDGNSSTDGADDGLVTLTWGQFKSNFVGYSRV